MVAPGDDGIRVAGREALSASVLQVVVRSVAARTAVVVLSDGTELQESVWGARGTQEHSLTSARDRARASAHYFFDPIGSWSQRAIARSDQRRFVSLPITTGRGLPLGLIQVEGTRAPTERDVVLMSSIVSFIAAALGEQTGRRGSSIVRAGREWPRESTKRRNAALAMLAHDLGNHLAVVQLNTETLLQVAGQDDSSRRRLVALIQLAVGDMRRLTGDLLDVTRIDAGTLTLRRRKYQAASLVDEAVRRLQPLAASRFIRLEGDFPPGDGVVVHCDGDRIAQVFSNLIGNALKFTPAQGRVVVRLEPHGNEVHFLVSDTGRGIASKDLPRVFERFWQARPQEQQGSGLGLSIAKGLVEALGGRIWVQSSLGRGSTFGFALRLD